jgi:hypothetical protein
MGRIESKFWKRPSIHEWHTQADITSAHTHASVLPLGELPALTRVVFERNMGSRSLPAMWRTGLSVLIVLCWAVGSVPLLAKYLHGVNLYASSLAGALCIATAIAGFRWILVARAGRVTVAWLVTFWAVMLALYLVLYPISQRHIAGVGSDSEDALRIAATQLMSLHYPYYARTYLGNLITPLPGAVLLAVPFQAVHRVSAQNIFWLAIFVGLCARFFRQRATALAFLAIMTFGNLVTLDQFVVGVDYTVNLWYVCAAVCVFLKAHEDNRSTWVRLAAGALLGVTLSSRPVYPLVFTPLLIAYLSQHKNLRGAIAAVVTPLLVAAGVTAPFYVYDPAHFAPLHIEQKLGFLPPPAAHMLLVVLPAMALLAACSGFFLRLTIARVFLIAGMASIVILLTPAVLLLLDRQSQEPSWALFGYANVSVTLIALWAFYALEDAPASIHGASR